MRSATILSGLATLALTAAAARAETNAWPQAAAPVTPAAVAPAPHPLDSFVRDAAPSNKAPQAMDKSGYNIKSSRDQTEAEVKKKAGKRASYYQYWQSDRQSLSPYGPPR